MEKHKHIKQNDEQHWAGLMVQSQAGDREAYNQLLTELGAAIESYIRVNFGAIPILEDCVQECLMAIHAARHTYNPKRPLRPWMFTVVRYKTIDMIRKAGSFKAEPLTEADQDITTSSNLVDNFERLIDGSMLLSKLSLEHRHAILLTKYHGMTSAEAAQYLGVKESALKARLRRGLKQIEQLWQNEWKK